MKAVRFCSVRHLIVILFLSGVACKKDSVKNQAPIVKGGDEQFVFMPAGSCLLKASSFDVEQNIVSYSWEKVSGPSSYVLENQDSLTAIVRNLEIGDYAFVLTATDKFGLQGSDTTRVKVLPEGRREIVFKNMQWICPMDCSITIENLYSRVPRTDSFEVYIRPVVSSTWTLVPREYNELYYYALGDESLTIFRGYGYSNADVKIVTF